MTPVLRLRMDSARSPITAATVPASTPAERAAPLVLGGPRSLWFTPIVYDRFYQAFNWPQGSAYAFILLLTCVAFVLAVLRLTKLSLGEITR